MKPPRLLALSATMLALGATLTACAAGASAGVATSGSDAADAFPVSIQNCGSELTLERAPQRIVLVNSDALANLEALGAVDRVVAVTSQPEEGLYEQATYDRLASSTVLTAEKNATGGSVVSQESILGAEPDLVIAPENAVDVDALAAAGVPVYTPTAYCLNPSAEGSLAATFDRVWGELRDYGAILGEESKAQQAIVDAQQPIASPAPSAGSAAAVYVSSGGSVISPYGAASMVTPVFEAAGLTNVYADVPDRVFDVNVEDLVARDPETVVVLYSGTDAESAVEAFRGAPGVGEMTAVRSGRVVALPFSYTDPPSVLSVRGPQELADRLAALG